MKKYNLKIEKDDYPESPRTWDNIGTMVCAHSRYKLGDVQKSDSDDVLAQIAVNLDIDTQQFENGDMTDEELLEKIKSEGYILPLNLYDHSGITMSTKGFADKWDSGQVGFIYVSKNELYNKHGINQEYLNAHAEWTNGRTLDKVAEDILSGEVETYDTYLRGNVYQYTLEELDEDGEVISEDSCSGFFGDDLKENGIWDNIPKEMKAQVEKYGTSCYQYEDGVEFDVKDGSLEITSEIKAQICDLLVEQDVNNIGDAYQIGDTELIHSILSGETQIYKDMKIGDLKDAYAQVFGETVEEAVKSGVITIGEKVDIDGYIEDMEEDLEGGEYRTSREAMLYV